MKKNTPIRLACTVSAQVDYYVRWLLAGGLHGNSRAEVVARLVCEGIRQAVPEEVVRKFTASFSNADPSPQEHA